LTFREVQRLSDSDSLNSFRFISLLSSAFGIFSGLSSTFFKHLSPFFYLPQPSGTFAFDSLNWFRFVPLPSSTFRLFSGLSWRVQAIRFSTPIRPLRSIGCSIRPIRASSALTAFYTVRFLARPSVSLFSLLIASPTFRCATCTRTSAQTSSGFPPPHRPAAVHGGDAFVHRPNR
jgi:hypothetical protein